MEFVFILPLITFLFGGFISLITYNKKVLSGIFLFSSSFSLLFFSLLIYKVFKAGEPFEVFYNFGGFAREIGIEYVLNSFSLALLTVVSFLIFAFSAFFINFVLNYSKPYCFNSLFCIIQVFCASAIAILMTNDLFNFYIFFELFSICAYIFTSGGGKSSSYAALNYLMIGIIGSAFIMLGIGILYFLTGFLNISKVADTLKTGDIQFNMVIPFILITLGFLIKLGIFPFSFWPPLVYKAMPTALIPLYTSVTSLVIIYGFTLFFSNFFSYLSILETFRTLFIWIILAGVVVFSTFSLLENDIRKIFAYSSLSQVSYVIFAILLVNNKAGIAGILHIISNSLSKMALFIILFEIGKEKMNYMISTFSGLATKSRNLCFLIIFLFAGIIGLPLTLGFFTKASMIFGALEEKSYLFIFIILFGAILNVLYFWRIGNVMFFKPCERSKTISMSFGSRTALTLITIALILLTLYFKNLLQFQSSAFNTLFLNV
jgi:multicomponent Na+:H+ antiporter subunit D